LQEQRQALWLVVKNRQAKAKCNELRLKKQADALPLSGRI
jgi:hypothetical protein